MNKKSLIPVNQFEVTCTGIGWQKNNSACNNTFYINAEYIRSKNIKDKSGKIVNAYGIICPICGCFTIIS